MNNHSRSTFLSNHHRGPLQIAGLYLLIGGLWILFSDRIAARIAPDAEMFARISMYKGWGFIIVTALLLYWLIRRHTHVLRGGEERLRLITDALPALISYVDADRRYQFSNRAYQEWFGHEAQGRHLEEVLGPDAYRAISGYVDRVLKGEFVTYETEIPYSEGGTRFVNATYVPDRGPNQHVKGFFALVQDITESRQAEEQLRQWADAFEGCAHGTAIVDPDTNRLTVCNPAFASLHKCRVEDIIGTALLGLYPPSDYDLVRRSIQRADQIGASRFEASMLRRDESTFPVLVDVVSVPREEGGLLHRVITAVDISDRKQAEEALRESEERYRVIFELTNDYAYEDRVEADGSIIPEWITSGVTRITGYTIEDMNAPDFWQRLVHPDDAPILLQHMRHILSGQADTIETRIITKSGEVRWLQDSAHPVWDEDQGRVTRIYGAAVDITENKRAQEIIDRKDELLRMTSEMAKVGGWEFDAVTLKGTWTDEVARIHDLDPSQETNVEMGLSFYVGESRQKIEQAVQESIDLGRSFDLELEMVSAKGTHKWVRTMALPVVENGKVVRVQGIFQDITERKQTEEALQKAHMELERKVHERTAALSQANAWLQAMMDHMPDHIYFKDRQSRFLRNSRSQATMLGLSDPAEVVGRTDFDFFPHAQQAYEEEQEVMRTGRPLVDLEEYVVWPGGGATWVSTTKVPLRGPEGQIIGIFGISRDITERKQAEDAIRQLNAGLKKKTAQLEAANEELEAFSYSVSHDLRAPLRAIDGFTRILLEDYEPILDDEGKRVCKIISREAQHMGQLIDDLLAFSRLGRKELHLTRIDMKAMAGGVFEELVGMENAGRIDFHVHRLPSTTGDSTLIRQAWVNLLSNAIKFTSKKERADIEVGSRHSESEHIYYVRDNGAGFDMEYVDKLFGVFQRLHGEKDFEGTGVGLAIVKRVVDRHGGRVWAEGEVDKGATFYFALPRKRE